MARPSSSPADCHTFPVKVNDMSITGHCGEFLYELREN
jgi:hypothetical protein